jgi:hypothetical protein
MLDADPTLRFRQCPISLVVSVALSALHQIPQQIRSHSQLGERQATGSDLLDRSADARSLRMGREPVLGGLLAGLPGCKHIGDQSSFGGCDLVNGAVDGETFEKIARRHSACGGDDAVETEIGLGGEEGRGRIADGAVGALCDRHDIRRGDQDVEIGEFAGKFRRDAAIGQILPTLAAPGLDVLRQGIVEPGGNLTDAEPKREITASRPELKSTLRTYQTTRECSKS